MLLSFRRSGLSRPGVTIGDLPILMGTKGIGRSGGRQTATAIWRGVILTNALRGAILAELKATTRYRLHGMHHVTGEVDVVLEQGENLLGRDPAAVATFDDPQVSRRHALITVRGGVVEVRDLDSANGTYVNGERVMAAELREGDRLRIGDLTLELIGRLLGDRRQTQIVTSADGAVMVVPLPRDPNATRVVDDGVSAGVVAAPPPAPARGVVPDEWLDSDVISEERLRSIGVDVQTCGFAGIGGGMGSFVWADLLRVSGVPAEAIAVIGNEERPYGRYERLCRNSQIPPHERLRSNSDSCPDNVWGFPAYAPREIWRAIRGGDLRLAGRLLWQIFGEPALVQTYTPRSGDVFRAVDREAARIGWPAIVRFGRARAIRRSAEGRLLVIASASDEQHRRHYAISAPFIHLAVGYPSLQLLPDLAEYREAFDDRTRVVNAYEQHDHIYEQLRAKGGTVVLRGRGIVASRIIQKLYEERHNNPKIAIVHLHRSRLTGGHTYGSSKREVDAEFEFQPFNWPKGCWTGEQRATMERADPEERKQLLEAWGGTTTADRRDWRRMVQEGLREGWYRSEYGVVKELAPTPDGRVTSRISNTLAGGGTLELVADFVIDCTGLIASPERSPLLHDLIDRYALTRNALGRLQVANDFEVTGMRHGSARMYASGAITLGGPHAAVDSFLGLQYAAYRAVEGMRLADPARIRTLNGWYSFVQWSRWARGKAP